MGRVIRTFITAVDVLGERISALPQRLPTAPKGRRQERGCHPAPLRPTQRLTGPNRGWICWRFHDREKMPSSLSTAYQNPASRRVYGRAPPGFFSLPFGPRAAKSGCGRQPAKSVWLPVASQTLCLLHPWVGEINFAGQAGNGVTGALRTARGSTLGLSCISCIFRRAISRAESSIHKSANSGPNPTQNLWEGYKELCFSAKKTTQRPTGGHEGLSCFCRSFATRWRSVASSSSARWLA